MSLSLFNELIQQGVLPKQTHILCIQDSEGWDASVCISGTTYTDSAPRKREAMEGLASKVITALALKRRSTLAEARDKYLERGGGIQVEYTQTKDGVRASVTLMGKTGPVQTIGNFKNVFDMNEFVKLQLRDTEGDWSQWDTLPFIRDVCK